MRLDGTISGLAKVILYLGNMEWAAKCCEVCGSDISFKPTYSWIISLICERMLEDDGGRARV
jgi:hypothetical protein